MKASSASLLQQFAQQYRLTTSRSDDGSHAIVTDLGELYEYSETELGVLFMPTKPDTRRWRGVKRKCEAAGMTPRQVGDCEGAFSFNPGDAHQAKTALAVIRVHSKKRISEDHLKALQLSRTAHKTTKGLSTDPLQASNFDDLGRDGTSGPRSEKRPPNPLVEGRAGGGALSPLKN